MALARWQATITDGAGDIQPGASITVRRESVGAPLVLLYSDRDGLAQIGNPFTADAAGLAAFHVAGGAYRITATLGAFSQTWRYVAIGTAGEFDLADISATIGVVHNVAAGYALLFESATVAPPSAGSIRLDNADLSAATSAFVSVTNAAGSDIIARLLELFDAARAVRDVIVLTDAADNRQASFQIDGAAAVGSPASHVTLTLSAHNGETGFTDGAAVTLQTIRAGANGPVTGPVSSVDGHAVLWNGAGGDALKSAGAAPSLAGHTHVKADITDFAHGHVKADIADFAHTHVKADIADFAHTHVLADISDYVPTLANLFGRVAPHRNLAMEPNATNPNSQVDVDADEMMLFNSSNHWVTVSAVNLTIDITASGANGLDTGAEAVSTWYHIWVIWNGSTVAGLLSASSTAPALPSGYTHAGYVGAVYNTSSSNFLGLSQRGVHVAQNITTNLSGGVATTQTAVAVLVPPTATIWRGLVSFSGADGGGVVGVHLSPVNSTVRGHQRTLVRGQNNTAFTELMCPPIPLIEPSTIYYDLIAGDGLDVLTSGWSYN